MKKTKLQCSFLYPTDDSDNEEVHDKNRLKATQKSNEHREKNKKRTQKDSSHERESDSEGWVGSPNVISETLSNQPIN